MIAWKERVEQYINLREARKPGSEEKFYKDVAKMKAKQAKFGGTEKGRIPGELLRVAKRGKKEFYDTWNRLQPTLPDKVVAFFKNRIFKKLEMFWRQFRGKGKEVILDKTDQQKVQEIESLIKAAFKGAKETEKEEEI